MLFRSAPKGTLGWLMLALVVMASGLAIFEMRMDQSTFSLPEPQPAKVVAAAPTEEPPLPTELPVKITAVPTKTPQPAATTQPTPTVVSIPTVQYALVVSESGVVVRESASTQAAITTYINNGLQVTLLGEKTTDQGMDWEKVIAPDGKEGWVAARFLSVINP